MFVRSSLLLAVLASCARPVPPKDAGDPTSEEAPTTSPAVPEAAPEASPRLPVDARVLDFRDQLEAAWQAHPDRHTYVQLSKPLVRPARPCGSGSSTSTTRPCEAPARSP